jgi:hypothetical protein
MDPHSKKKNLQDGSSNSRYLYIYFSGSEANNRAAWNEQVQTSKPPAASPENSSCRRANKSTRNLVISCT